MSDKTPILYVSDGSKFEPIKAIKGEKGDKGDRGDGPSEEQMHAVASEEIAKVIAEAPEDFDTLKEISDWINTHEDSAAAMNTAIQQNTADIEELKNGGAKAGTEITYEDFLKLSEEEQESGDYYITDYPDTFAKAENIPFDDSNVNFDANSVQTAIEKASKGGRTISEAAYNALTDKSGSYYVETDEGDITAQNIKYDNTTSGLSANNVQTAIDTVNSNLSDKEWKLIKYFPSGEPSIQQPQESISIDLSEYDEMKLDIYDNGLALLTSYVVTLDKTINSGIQAMFMPVSSGSQIIDYRRFFYNPNSKTFEITRGTRWIYPSTYDTAVDGTIKIKNLWARKK